MRISYRLARLLGGIAEAEALAVEVPMAVAVADEEGMLLFFGRMDGVLPVSPELAISKAYTAAALRMATHEAGRLAQPGGELYGIQHTHPGKIVLFGGGLPLRLEGKVAGAIGISGGTVAEDIRVAEAAVKALEQMEALSAPMNMPRSAMAQQMGGLHRLESVVDKELQKMNCAFSPGELSIITGAVVLAATRME